MRTSDSIHEIAAAGDYWTGLLRFPGVFVSFDGRVASVRSGKARVLRGMRRGKYLALSAVAKGPYIHQLICEAFHGPAPAGAEVRHLDGDRDNNHALNLAWGTCAENAADKVRHGTDPAGARNGMARLTAEQVEQMRQLRRDAGLSYRQIGANFGVSTMTAFRAVRGQSWK
jgi:hypothetical protein